MKANCKDLTESQQLSVSFLPEGVSAGPTLVIRLEVRNPNAPVIRNIPSYLANREITNQFILFTEDMATSDYRLHIRDGTAQGTVRTGGLGDRNLTQLEFGPSVSDLRLWASVTSTARVHATHLIRRLNPAVSQPREMFAPMTTAGRKVALPFDNTSHTTPTRYFIANVSGAAANCSQTLWADGRLTAPENLAIPPNSMVTGLFGSPAGVKQGLLSLACNVDITATAVRVNEAGNVAMYEAVVPENAPVPETKSILPLIADGRYHLTSLFLVNTSSATQSYSLAIQKRRADGLIKELLPATGTVPAGGIAWLTSSGSGDTPFWLTQLTGTFAWGELVASSAVKAFLVYHQEGNSSNPFETVVPVRALGKNFVFPFDATGGNNASLMLVNPKGEPGEITLKYWSETGEELLSETVRVAAGASHFHAMRASKVAERRGWVDLSSTTEISPVYLRSNGRPFAALVPEPRQ